MADEDLEIRGEMGEAQFGVSFFTSSQRQDTCGTNGLPLTPNSIRILGKAQFLKSLSHQNLALYVDILRGKNERIVVVSEYYCNNLRLLMKSEASAVSINQDEILRFAKEVLLGLAYLNKQGIVMRNLSPETVLLNGAKRVKLFNYGLYHMTNNGKYVAFPIGNVKYTAPELLLSGMNKGLQLYCCDVWSLGIILVELIMQKEIWCDFKLQQIVRKIADLKNCDRSVLVNILEDHGSSYLLESISSPLKSLLDQCLELNPSKRPCPETLLNDKQMFGTIQPKQAGIVGDLMEGKNMSCINSSYYARKFCTSYSLTRSMEDKPSAVESNGYQDRFTQELPTDLLTGRTLNEIYYLWQRAGGDVLAELKRQGLTRKKPAVLSLPRLMTLEGETFGKSKERGLLLDNTVVILPLNELRKRLNNIPPEDYFPLLDFTSAYGNGYNSMVVKESVNLPLIIRERDIEYQFHRIILFERLLKGYPYTINYIHKESLQDIPPFFRAQVWSCLLDIKGDIEYHYKCIDKETPTSTDRQIEVDIPRCHQYDELLSSPSGHEKFKRVLKAWVVSNTEYVYWQGLDSLCAPFLYLNFNNEAMAFACLSAFIPKYLYNFFLKDNSVIIQEYLCKFSQLIAFHDPQLTNHLDSIGFIPELYAIPWFLTMFSHVFPLHKIFHLWDKLLLGDSSFSLCIGLAILYQLRESLLNSGFNECILLFSDMPEIDIEKCVQSSVEIFCSTPRSALRRKHEPPLTKLPMRNGGPSNDNFPLNGTTTANKEALVMEPIPLSDLKIEKCPRISGEDFLELLDLNQTKFQKPKMIVIDVRNSEDYNRGAVPGSINIPFSTTFDTSTGSITSSGVLPVLNTHRGKILCVVGNRGDSAIKFAEAILRLGCPRVCVLHRGIDIFRSSSLLEVRSTIN